MGRDHKRREAQGEEGKWVGVAASWNGVGMSGGGALGHSRSLQSW